MQHPTTTMNGKEPPIPPTVAYTPPAVVISPSDSPAISPTHAPQPAHMQPLQPRTAFSPVAHLPPPRINYRVDSPEPAAFGVKSSQHSFGFNSNVAVPSPQHRLQLPEGSAAMPRNRSFHIGHDDAEQAKIGLFLSAAQRDNVDRVLQLLDQGVAVNSTDYDRRSALHVACSDGASNVVRTLIEEGADVNAKDRFGHTPLDDAVSNGFGDIAELLRFYSATHGSMAKLEAQLIVAAADNNLNEAALLLNNGVNVNCCDYDRRTPLHLAVGEGHLEMAKLLLSHKANPHAEDRWNSTPLTELQRRLTRTGRDPMQDAFREILGDEDKSTVPWFSKFACFYGFWQVVFIVLFGIFMKYGDDSAGGSANADPTQMLSFATVYPLFQDVHVMIFVGFAFLMAFLRKHGYSSLAITFLLAAFVLQEYQLVRGFWQNVFAPPFNYLTIDIPNIVQGDFCAGAVLIAFGVVLGKVSPSQMMLLALIQTVFYGLNERIGFVLQASDLGGTMTIHLFGACFGVAASLMTTPRSAHGNQNNAAVYHSDMFAFIGTIFLFMYWPSFNAALGVGTVQPRAVINTLLSISASAVSGFLASYVLRRKGRFSMVDVQNATLAGGVAMGACCSMLIQPGAAMGIGAIAGVLSVFGFVHVQPWLERVIGLHDTCGVNNLHLMPSVLGAAASIIAAAQAESSYSTFDNLSVFGIDRSDGSRSASYQALMQFVFIITSSLLGLSSGFFAGLIARLPFFEPPKEDDAEGVFQDEKYFEVPELELPFYFDHRGEISRGAGNLNEGDLRHVNDPVSSTSSSTSSTSPDFIQAKSRYQRQLESKLEGLEQQVQALKKQQRSQDAQRSHSYARHQQMQQEQQQLKSSASGVALNTAANAYPPFAGTYAPMPPMPPMSLYPQSSLGHEQHPGFYYAHPPPPQNPPYFAHPQSASSSSFSDPNARMEQLLGRLLQKLDDKDV